MAKYRKKPVIVDAIPWDGTYECAQEMNVFNGNRFWPITDDRRLKIPTLEGLMIADIGDMVIKGTAGEFYPCKPDIFQNIYEKVED